MNLTVNMEVCNESVSKPQEMNLKNHDAQESCDEEA